MPDDRNSQADQREHCESISQAGVSQTMKHDPLPHDTRTEETMHKLVAFRTNETAAPIRVARRERGWMDELDQRYAYRCLPLVMANQFGWEVLGTHHVSVTWDGSRAFDALRVKDLGGDGPVYWHSHFGSGILTFGVPFLFKTSPNWNLFVRGPTNYAKDGIVPLDGVVETDWSHAPFTMNWRFTRPCTIEFQIGEPVCMFFPVERRLFEKFHVEMADLATNPDLNQKFNELSESRTRFNRAMRASEPAALKQKWQKDYFRAAKETKPRPQEIQSELKAIGCPYQHENALVGTTLLDGQPEPEVSADQALELEPNPSTLS